MKKQNKNAFTLVELIVVITILAILWTIAFISLQWYSRDARDSKRVADIDNIKKSLELFKLNSWKYPTPDNAEDVTYSWALLWKQWIISDNVLANLSRNLNEKPIDPLTEKEYIYSTLHNNSQYEILSLYEWNLGPDKIKIDGTYNGLFVRNWQYIVPTPSIITSESLPLVIGTTTISSQVVSWWKNIPDVWHPIEKQSTWALNFPNFEVYTWTTITSKSTETELLNVYNTIANTYSGSSLSNNKIISDLLSKTTDEEKVSITETIVLNKNKYVATNNDSNDTVTYWDWRDVDPNCDKPDITIWTQTWAWCNSTIWTWMEFINNSTDSCYDYEWNNWQSCTNEENLSTAKENTWNSTYGINNIWWKLYTWGNARNTACENWYHLPSDEEWYNLEVALWSTDRSTNWEYSWIKYWRYSDWLWWKNYTSKNASNNLVKALGLPLAGYRDTDGSTFGSRGRYIYLWSNTSSGTNTYYRLLRWDYSKVFRGINSQNYGFSVRCIKD